MSRLVAVVHYFTPELAAAAVGSVVQTWCGRASGDRVVLVDNGCSESTRDTLRRLPCELLTDHGNLGYAGAVNYALSRGADQVIVLNADVRVEAGCLDQLFDELVSGTAVCGPSFFWDEELTIHLPPAQSAAWSAAMLDVLAQKSSSMARIVRRRFRTLAWRHWLARRALASWRLSGALMAFRSDAFHRVGPFDEEFELYFEETDWLVRARRCGLEARYVPSARAVHHYDQSPEDAIGLSRRKRELFEASAARFRRRHYGAVGSRLLEFASRFPVGSVTTAVDDADRSPAPTGFQAEWVEWSPRVSGLPMAARRGADRQLPSSVSLPGEAPTLFRREVAADGREIRCVRVQPSTSS